MKTRVFSEEDTNKIKSWIASNQHDVNLIKLNTCLNELNCGAALIRLSKEIGWTIPSICIKVKKILGG